jgi:hypothetical protein
VISGLEVSGYGTANIVKANTAQTGKRLLAQGAETRFAAACRKSVVSELVDEQDFRRVQGVYVGQICIGDAV